MRKKNIFIIVFILIIILIVSFVLLKKYQNSSVEHQINKLKNGNSEQKIMAAIFMGDNGIYNTVSTLIQYIDSEEWFLYKGKAGWYLSCASTQALEKITGRFLGDTCDSESLKTDKEIEEIKNKWENWYENEYPEWRKNFE